MSAAPAYAELHALSNFSFLRGASHPEELVQRAFELGYAAIAVTDECSLAGVVRAHQRARTLGMHLIIGSELQLDDGPKLALLARNQTGYSQLCRLITRARRRASKGCYSLGQDDLAGTVDDCLALLLPRRHGEVPDAATLEWFGTQFAGRSWLAAELHRQAGDSRWLQALQQAARDHELPLLASGDVHMHCRERRALQDTLTAIRHGCTLAQAGQQLFPNGERHLRSPARLAALYPPELLAETLRVAQQCRFSLDQLDYTYPAATLPPDRDANTHLRELTFAGARQRWPDGPSPKVRRQLENELALIAELGYPQYFLTVHDIVQWAREHDILCQGRGSAANSAVCYALGITVVDPEHSAMLFERFMSRERNEPPDIDVDFEHERREEVFQHIYATYGRTHAALAATVIRYRPRSALRDVGKALGLSLDDVTQLSRSLAWWDDESAFGARLREQGFDPEAPVMQLLHQLVADIQDCPRHLSQHVGGFVMSARPLHELVPVENAAMTARTVIQWDKDDLDAVGLLKVDCLALGMLTAIHKTFDEVRACKGPALSIAQILRTEHDHPDQARSVYRMLSRADSVGVFQVESRAQMSMLPRLQPREFYDLVIETAIVRPGPIQGGMVHPYLRRRMGLEETNCPRGLEAVLERTHGVPIFQEQVMEICVIGAGFAPGEADQVRRSMAAWRRNGNLAKFERRLKSGLARNGYTEEFAERIFQQIQGFAEYGFPESHAASFAVLIYVSAWLKRFEPAAFLAGLLNSQPMGFYSPSQLIQDARRQHGLEVLPADVNHSRWESHVISRRPGRIRLGLNRVKGLNEAVARRLVAGQPYASIDDLRQRGVDTAAQLDLLARAGALAGLSRDRHEAVWLGQGSEKRTGVLEQAAPTESAADLRPPSEGELLVSDYTTLGFTLGRHPLALLRDSLERHGALNARRWRVLKDGQRCRVAGLVTNRQRPGTARGIIFMTLEDETGQINLVIRPEVFENYRSTVLGSALVIADGINESRHGVSHLIVTALADQQHLLGRLRVRSRDFH